MRPPNRPDFMYEKPSRIEEMCGNHRLMGFPTHACRALVLVLSSYAYQEIVSLLLADQWRPALRRHALQRRVDLPNGLAGHDQIVSGHFCGEVFDCLLRRQAVRHAVDR